MLLDLSLFPEELWGLASIAPLHGKQLNFKKCLGDAEGDKYFASHLLLPCLLYGDRSVLSNKNASREGERSACFPHGHTHVIGFGWPWENGN